LERTSFLSEWFLESEVFRSECRSWWKFFSKLKPEERRETGTRLSDPLIPKYRVGVFSWIRRTPARILDSSAQSFSFEWLRFPESVQALE